MEGLFWDHQTKTFQTYDQWVGRRDTSITMRCDSTGNISVKNRSHYEEFGKDFEAASEFMWSLVRRPQGDPK